MAEAFSEGSGCKTSSTVDRRGGIRIEMHCVLSCVDTAGLARLRRSFAREGLPVLNCLGGSGALTSSPAAGGCQCRSCFVQPMLGWLLSARDIASALHDGGPGAAAGRLVSVVTSITLALIVAAVGGRGSFMHLGDCREEFTRCICSSLLISSTYHKNTNAKAELVNGVWVTRCGPSPMAQGRLGSPLTSRPPRSLAT